MSLATHANTIRLRFYNEWKTIRGFTDAEMVSRVAWPNKNFTKPSGFSWVRYTLLPATASQVTIGTVGGRTFRYGGRIVVQVFTPENAGDTEAMAWAEEVAGIFRGVTADGVRYSGPGGEAPRIRTIGNDGAGWFQVNVECPFGADLTA